MSNPIKKITQEDIERLRNKTVYGIPDNPSDKGFSASQIKAKIADPSLILAQWLKILSEQSYETFEYFYNNLDEAVKESVDAYLQNEVEMTSNKVTTISESSTDKQYPTAKLLYNTVKTWMEIAQGKCKSYVLSNNYQINESSWSNYTVYDENGDPIATWADFQTLVGVRSLLNEQLKTQTAFNDTFSLAYVLTGSYPSFYFHRAEDYFADAKTGDVLLVIETNVPDRWLQVSTNSITFNILETAKVDIANMVTTNTDQTITGEKKIENGKQLKFGAIADANYFYIKGDGNYLYIGAFGIATQLKLGRYFTSFSPEDNGSQSIGDSTHHWKDLHLRGTQTFYSNDDNGENWNVVNTSGNLYFRRTGLSATFIIGGVRVTSKTIIPVDNGNQTLGQSNALWKDLYLAGNITDGTAYFTVDSAYNILYGKTINNLPILEYENKNVITTSLGTTITLRAAKTGCLPVYEGFITNISASAISFGFPNSLTLLTNDEDNVSVSGSILTIGAGVTIEFSLCDNKLVAINWAV